MPRPRKPESTPAAVTATAAQLGANIATARRRRGWRQIDLAAKAGISPVTLRKVEDGDVGAGLGTYLMVLWAMGLDAPIRSIAAPEHDREGLTLATAKLGKRARLTVVDDDDF